MRTPILSVLFALLPAVTQAQGDRARWRSDYPAAKTTIELAFRHQSYVRPGEPVTVEFRVSERAYVAVFHVDGNGNARVIFPQRGRRSQLVDPSAEPTVVRTRSGSMVGSFRASSYGSGLVIGIVSEFPLDVSALAHVDDYSRAVSYRQRPFIGSTARIIDRLAQLTVPNYEYAEYDYDFLYYNVERTRPCARYAYQSSGWYDSYDPYCSEAYPISSYCGGYESSRNDYFGWGMMPLIYYTYPLFYSQCGRDYYPRIASGQPTPTGQPQPDTLRPNKWAIDSLKGFQPDTMGRFVDRQEKIYSVDRSRQELSVRRRDAIWIEQREGMTHPTAGTQPGGEFYPGRNDERVVRGGGSQPQSPTLRGEGVRSLDNPKYPLRDQSGFGPPPRSSIDGWGAFSPPPRSPTTAGGYEGRNAGGGANFDGGPWRGSSGNGEHVGGGGSGGGGYSPTPPPPAPTPITRADPPPTPSVPPPDRKPDAGADRKPDAGADRKPQQ